MFKIRKGVFETNSSSMHSITISDSWDSVPSVVDFDIGEYGWGYETLHTPDERASYLYTMMATCNMDTEENIKMLSGILENYGIKSSFETVGRDRYGLSSGYVDHQSVDREFVEELLDNSGKLMCYLFGEGSYVVIDNDNH